MTVLLAICISPEIRIYKAAACSFFFKLNFLIVRFYEFLIYSGFLISYMTCNYFLPSFVDSLYFIDWLIDW